MKIIVYMKHCFLNDYRNVAVKTVDPDGITLFLAHVSLLNLPYKMEVHVRFGKDRMFYKINDVCLRISPERQPAPIVLITFTGCVITSLFFEILKRVHGEMYRVRMHTSHILSLNLVGQQMR